ncbi:MAG: hypothetical protein L0196_05065 [candidate division Zixibacteria bacterium]|nr:hypothetical protein [candidate division Zixibacteria bacterium]
MKKWSFTFPSAGLTILGLLTLVVVQPAKLLAGPPLVCHPFEIGNASSLPAGSGPFGMKGNYDRSQLVEQTLTLLKSETPVIVRMETLRRAAVYVSRGLAGLEGNKGYSNEDKALAFALVSRLSARALDAESEGRSDALAWFDAGYFIESCEQAGFRTGLAGYDWVKKALALRGGDSEIEFAAALMCSMKGRGSRDEHLRKASAGARKGSLLAANIDKHFGKR